MRTYVWNPDGTSSELDSSENVLRTNLATNPWPTATSGFGWVSNSNASNPVFNDTSFVRRPGTASLRGDPTDGADNVLSLYGAGAASSGTTDANVIHVEAGETYRFSVYAAATFADAEGLLIGTFHDSTGTQVGAFYGDYEDSPNTLAVEEWGRFWAVFTVPVGAETVRVGFLVRHRDSVKAAVGDSAWAQDVLLTEGSEVGTYFDGGTPDDNTSDWAYESITLDDPPPEAGPGRSPWSYQSIKLGGDCFGNVTVGGSKKTVAAMSVIIGGVKKPVSSVSVIRGGTKKALQCDGGGAPPPAPLWRKPLIGAGGGVESEQYTPLNNIVGPMMSRRSYDGALPSSFANSNASSDVAAGRHSYWSWKPNPEGFRTSTAQQNAFAAFLRTIPAGHKVTIFGQHEPENNMHIHPDVAGYGALQNTIANIVRAEGNPNLRFGPCFMGPWTWDSRSPYYDWINQWGPAMDWSKFDVIGIDPYASIHPGGFSFEQMLTVRNSGSGGGSALSVMQWLSQWDIPVVIAEWGYYRKQPSGHGTYDPPVDPIPDQVVADWITDAYDWFKRWNAAHPTRIEGGRERGSPIDSAMWFNTSLVGADTPLTGPLSGPVSTGPKLDAYAAIVADSKIPVTSP